MIWDNGNVVWLIEWLFTMIEFGYYGKERWRDLLFLDQLAADMNKTRAVAISHLHQCHQSAITAVHMIIPTTKKLVIVHTIIMV